MHVSGISVVVRDYDEAIDFWVGKVGLEVLEDRQMESKRWVVVGNGHTGCGLILGRAANAEQMSVVGKQGGGRVFGFISTDDFAAAHQRMRAAGVHFTEEPRHESYGCVAVFEDLYGNRWDLIEPVAGRSL